MPEPMPASGTGGGTVPGDSAAGGNERASLTDDLRRVAGTLADAVNAVPLDRRAVVAEHLSAAVHQLASLVGDVLRRAVSSAPDALPATAPVAAVPEPLTRLPAADARPPEGSGRGPEGGQQEPPAGGPVSLAAGVPGGPVASEETGIDATTSLATRLVAQARHRRGVYGDPSRGVLDDPDLQPPPQVTAASVVPFSDDPDRPDRRRRAGAGPVAAEPAPAAASPESGAEGERPEATRRSDPVVASLQWAVAAGRAVIVGFADVVGVADPGTATRLLQTRVLGTLQPGDVAVMVGPGEVTFVLLDADLVEADRRFRHLVPPPSGEAPAVRLGFVVPRAGEDPVDVVTRARTAATGRWSRVRVGPPT